MCDCPEIQGLKKFGYTDTWQAGDYFSGKDEFGEKIVAPVVKAWSYLDDSPCYEIMGDDIRSIDSTESYIWLPRQDQLQEISGLSWALFDKACIQREYVFSTTKELAGIQVVMKEKHNKEWSGEKWKGV